MSRSPKPRPCKVTVAWTTPWWWSWWFLLEPWMGGHGKNSCHGNTDWLLWWWFWQFICAWFFLVCWCYCYFVKPFLLLNTIRDIRDLSCTALHPQSLIWKQKKSHSQDAFPPKPIGGSWNRGSLNHHPFLDGIFPNKNHPAFLGFPHGDHGSPSRPRSWSSSPMS